MTNVEQVTGDENFRICLDHGFCGLIDHMGDDAAIAQAARNSYGKGTRSVRDDRNLLRYLIRHQHTTPFEMAVAKFHMRMPIFVARQFVRHRTASINEMSARYSIIEDEFYIPEPEVLAGQSTENRQGRQTVGLDEATRRLILDTIAVSYTDASDAYDYLLGGTDVDGASHTGIARELARVVLPVGVYTEWYWCANLHNIMRFLHLRLDGHAQYEIRVYAQAMYQLLAPLFPITMQAFDDYLRHAVHLSRMEIAMLTALFEQKSGSFLDMLGKLGDEESLRDQFDLSKREYHEFIRKFTSVERNSQLSVD